MRVSCFTLSFFFSLFFFLFCLHATLPPWSQSHKLFVFFFSGNHVNFITVNITDVNIIFTKTYLHSLLKHIESKKYVYLMTFNS